MQERRRYCSQLLVLLELIFLIISFYVVPISGKSGSGLIEVDVGVIFDADHIHVGKVTQTCISMALEDFYALNQNHTTTRIVLHERDSKGDVVEAASAAIDLLKNVQVQAILGPQRSSQAEFVIDIGNKTRVPIISQAMSPSLSPADNPYFIRGAQNGHSQVDSLTAIVQAFGWREVVLIYEDTNYGRGVPFLTNSFQGISTQVRHRSVLSLSASDDHILQELYKLKTMQTRVFVVHMLPFLASRFFTKVRQAEMMNKGYVWIITDGLTALLDALDPTVINSMQGVIGVKPYVPPSSQLENFKVRWRKRFRQENPDVDRFEMNVFGLWAYDSATALAMAVGRSGIGVSKFKKSVAKENLTDLAAIGISEMGPRLLQSLQNIEFNGLSGKFHLLNGQLQPSSFQIVNVIGKGDREIGFWTREYGISRNLSLPSSKNYSTNKDELGAIIWPGESNVVPKGWEVPTGDAKLRVGVPVKGGFSEFVSVKKRDPQTNAVNATGFCIDVFKEVMDRYLPYAVPYEFFPFETPDGKSSGSYDNLVYQIFLGKYDAVVGDITILSNRSMFVDFTLPYTESGVAMVVPFEDDDTKNAWIFMKPLKMDLWLTTGFFFVFTGFVVWVFEHRVNKEFRGPPGKQVGMIFWFSFSTLVFAHKERLISNLSRFVVIVWVFVVLVLTSSYTASLTSMLTVQKLKPSVTDIEDLRQSKEYVGYQEGSFVEGLLKNKEFDTSKFKDYATFEEYDEALAKGSKNGGVAAIIDELPYIRLFLSNPKYCAKYTVVGPIYKTAGFGFAFPKGSPLVPDVSRAVLNVTEQTVMTRIEEKWLGKGATCAEQDGARVTSDSLTLDSFKGLFIVAGVASLSALMLFLTIFLYENWDSLASNDSSIREKVIAMAKTFDKEKEISFDASKRKHPIGEGMAVPTAAIADCPQSPATSDSHLAEWIFSQDEGFSTTETNTPIHETIEIVESNEER